MARKSKEIKPFPTIVSLLLILVAFVAMGVFVTYVVSPSGNSDVSHVDSLGEQSFEVETSVEPPPPSVVEVKEYMSDASVGDVVTFGSYEQNGNTDDGAEPIEWVVLEENDESLLLISRYCLACKPYNTDRTQDDWKNSSLRAWLNGDFYNTAFTETEKTGIVETEYLAEIHDAAFITDKVFLLSELEAMKYYEYDSWRITSATQAAVNEGVRVEDGSCWWWLRTRTLSNNPHVIYVHFDGSIKDIGFAVDYNAVAVRPTIWVSADAEKESESSEISE